MGREAHGNQQLRSHYGTAFSPLSKRREWKSSPFIKNEAALKEVVDPSWDNLPLVNSHLDLAENVTLFGLDLTLSIAERRALEKRTTGQATVSLPEMERGGIAVACATVTPGFLTADVGEDFEPKSALYHTSEEAEAQALSPNCALRKLAETGACAPAQVAARPG